MRGIARRAIAAIAAVATIVAVSAPASCGREPPRTALGPPPALPEQRRAARASALPEWFWEPVDTDVHAEAKLVELPVAEASLVRVEGATRVWDELGADGRERLRRDGLVVASDARGRRYTKMGAFYMDAREQRVPYVITLDALAHVVHVAFEHALAEVDEHVLLPQLDLLLTKLEARLGAEQKGAGVEIAEGLRLARGLVAVARGLAGPSSPPPADLGPESAQAIAQEIAHVVAHEGSAHSALLGLPIDYARFTVPSSAARPGAFRAMAWLSAAPLALVAHSEAPPGARGRLAASVGVGTSRLHARAAMLLSRVAEREIDPQIHAAWSRIARLSTFVWGPPDDLAAPELAEMATAIGMPLGDPKNIANVVAVDRLRHRAASGRAPLVFDGAGVGGRAGISMRLLGGHAPADSIALAALTTADGKRPLPSTLDIAVWLGAPEARAALHESGGDASAGYDAALARAVSARPPDEAASRHASVHGSLLDVVMTWLMPREGTTRPLASVAAQRAAIESALAAWTFARHEGQPLSRARPSHPAHAAKELHVTGAVLPAFVEASPDVIARLVATVGQMKRGLGAIAGLPPTSQAMTTLAEVDDILRLALRIASRETNDEALSSEDVTALGSLPARFARLDEPGEEGGAGAMVPLVAEVFSDSSGERVLSSATGFVEPALTVVREPGTGRLMLALGAHVAHHQLIEPRRHQSTDALYRARLAKRAKAEKTEAPEKTAEKTENRAAVAEGDGPDAEKSGGVGERAPYTSSFRLVR